MSSNGNRSSSPSSYSTRKRGNIHHNNGETTTTTAAASSHQPPSSRHLSLTPPSSSSLLVGQRPQSPASSPGGNGAMSNSPRSSSPLSSSALGGRRGTAASGGVGKARKKTNSYVLPVRFCISWNRVLVLLLLFYVGVLYVLHSKLSLQQQSKLQLLSGAALEEMEGLSDIAQPDGRVGSTSRTTTGQQRPRVLTSSVQKKLQSMQETLEKHKLVGEMLRKENKRLQSCRWKRGTWTADTTCPTTATTATAGGASSQALLSYLYYNPSEDQIRILCNGQELPPKSHAILNAPLACNGGGDSSSASSASSSSQVTSRLFGVIPDTTGLGLSPVTLYFDGAENRRASPFEGQCPIPCYESGKPGIVCKRGVLGTDWSFAHSMEGEAYYGHLHRDPTAYKKNQFYATVSFDSEIPLPYFSWAEYKIQEPAAVYEKAIPAAAFMARNCGSHSGREKMVKELLSHSKDIFRIDSLSSCLNNAKLPAGVKRSDKLAIMHKYMFYLAFENQNIDDYITEKMWGAYHAGTIPVYWGAPNIKQHVPAGSAIFVQDFNGNMKALSEYLRKVSKDKALYESYHAWRKKPLPAWFRAKYDYTHTHSTCRMCQWAYAKRYGLGWNHTDQKLVGTVIPRTVCVDPTTNLMTSPLREEWEEDNNANMNNRKDSSSSTGGGFWSLSSSSKSSTNVQRPSCSGGAAAAAKVANVTKRVALVRGGTIRRTLYEQDGIVDVHLEEEVASSSSSTDAVASFRLITPLQRGSRAIPTTMEMISKHHARIQNDKARVTLLADVVVEEKNKNAPPNNNPVAPRTISLSFGGGGNGGNNGNGEDDDVVAWVDLRVRYSTLPARIRIIVEDLDTFHEGATKEENYFAQTMIKDFFHPVEAFVILPK